MANYLVELLTGALCLLLLVINLMLPKQKEKFGLLAGIGLSVIFVISLFNSSQSQTLFDGIYIFDSFSTFFKQLFLIAAILTVLVSRDYHAFKQGEYYAFIVSALLGMMIMASAGELITKYVGLELMTISFSILVAFKGDDKSKEASMKYIILSSMSSGILLYGLSLM
ncbi:MAG: NADH-quinone oxidoreductase subunit N, partial [Ruminiclostridium sp.]|nr:NADH-quinone oxidoreductase subunit N [Ruminiclostridium sp.]